MLNLEPLQKIVYFINYKTFNINKNNFINIQNEFNLISEINKIFQENLLRKESIERLNSYNELFEINRQEIFKICEELGLIKEYSSNKKFNICLILGAAKHSMIEESKYFNIIKDKNFNNNAKVFLLGGKHIFKEETKSEIDIMYNLFKQL